MAVCQNLVPLVNPKIAGKWMFIPLKMVCIVGIDPSPNLGFLEGSTNLSPLLARAVAPAPFWIRLDSGLVIHPMGNLDKWIH